MNRLTPYRMAVVAFAFVTLGLIAAAHLATLEGVDVGLAVLPSAPDGAEVLASVIGDSATYEATGLLRRACIAVDPARADSGVGVAALWGIPGQAEPNRVLVVWYPDAAHRHLDLVADSTGLHVSRFRTTPCGAK